MEKIKLELNETIRRIDNDLAINENYDIIKREMSVGGRKTYMYTIDGFSSDDFIQKIIQFLCDITQEEMPQDEKNMMNKKIPTTEVELVDEFDKLYKDILSGQLCIIIEGYKKAILVDSREYPARQVSEPDKDKVLRGSKDSFIETMVFNSALIRRRIRSTKLRMKSFEIGESSRTDIAVCYMSDRVKTEVLEKIKCKLNNIKTDSLTMNQESLGENLCRSSWINPFPKYKYTERPDAAAASILDGCIVILIDNSPLAMIIPASLFDITEEANDYYFPPVTGTYLKLTRFIVGLVSVILTPLFLLLMQEPTLVPDAFAFIRVKETINIPILAQFLILELAVDGMKMAAINSPNMLNTPLSIIAGLVIGDFAVSSGWFNAETMLYMAFVTVANYSQVNFELGYAMKFMRIISLILTSIFGLYGFAAGILVLILSAAFNRTPSGRSYLYPLIPFNGRQLFRRVFRIDIRKAER